MSRRFLVLAAMLITAAAHGRASDPTAPYWSTFSIIAVDPATGMAGIAIASSTWTEHASDILTPGISPGTGIIVSQAALLERNYARGVQLLKEGKSPKEVIDTLKREDRDFETRQIAVVDISGRSEAFSGAKTLQWSGSRSGPFFSAQGNILVNDKTVPAVAAAFAASEGQPLADRLMAALVAGSRAGGDARGKQFATLQVMKKGPDGTPVNDVVFDIADSPDPVVELDRLFRIHKVSIDLATVGQLRREGKAAEAIALGEAALRRLPDGHRRQPYESLNTALAVLYYQAGDKERARTHLKAGADALPIHRRLFEQRAQSDAVAKQMLDDEALTSFVYGAAPRQEDAAVRRELVRIKAAAMSADYRSDLDGLDRVRADATKFTSDSSLGYLAHYWAGFASWRSALNGANRRMAVDIQRTHLEAALADFEASIAARSDFADGYAAAASVTGFLGTLKSLDAPAFAEQVRRMRELLGRAVALAPDNPRVLWVQGGNYLFAPPDRGGDRAKAIAIYRRMIDVSGTPAPERPDPDWGLAEAWMSIAYAHVAQEPVDPAAALDAANQALRVSPDWSYVRDILLPQIRKAGAAR